ncbi:hypothetical protein GNP79_06970 [Aliivibrio fischeri]|uniref:Uncharacterized protein n=1 Tax=Aliivibrio fischeri TaxID=668 RepID=A0A6N3YWT7_ALIFS|nr:hypothetical protein [Aliivibrio fischeri]MUK44886.1 hypothetical protein [Aliivibrio fischeri]MUK80545.1 hypothetical protein [Aliivibrio fischeri]MUK84446.1 hypothetical protein [Aliivibrio fischeri]
MKTSIYKLLGGLFTFFVIGQIATMLQVITTMGDQYVLGVVSILLQLIQTICAYTLASTFWHNKPNKLKLFGIYVLITLCATIIIKFLTISLTN